MAQPATKSKKNRSSIPGHVRNKIYLRDSFTCQYCGRQVPLHFLSLDHIVPRSLGGTNAQKNLVTACKRCNTAKASMDPISWLVQCVFRRGNRLKASVIKKIFAAIWEQYKIPSEYALRGK